MRTDHADIATRATLLMSICPGWMIVRGFDVEWSFGDVTTRLEYGEEEYTKNGYYAASCFVQGSEGMAFIPPQSVSLLQEALDIAHKVVLIFRGEADIPQNVRRRHLYEIGIGWGAHFHKDSRPPSMGSAADDEAFEYGVAYARQQPRSTIERDFPFLFSSFGKHTAQQLLVEEALRHRWGVSFSTPGRETLLTVTSPEASVCVAHGNTYPSVTLRVKYETRLDHADTFSNRMQSLLTWGQCAQLALCREPKGINDPNALAHLMGSWWAKAHKDPVKIFDIEALHDSFIQGFVG